VSDRLGRVLHHADELLAEWERFAAQTRTRIDLEVHAIGATVAAAVETSVDRAVERVSAGVDAAVERTVEARVGLQLTALAAELTRLEHRARGAVRLAENRGRHRLWMWTAIAGLGITNVFLAILLLRTPEPAPDSARAAPPAAQATSSALQDAPVALPDAGAMVDMPAGATEEAPTSSSVLMPPTPSPDAPTKNTSLSPGAPAPGAVRAGSVPRPKRPRGK